MSDAEDIPDYCREFEKRFNDVTDSEDSEEIFGKWANTLYKDRMHLELRRR